MIDPAVLPGEREPLLQVAGAQSVDHDRAAGLRSSLSPRAAVHSRARAVSWGPDVAFTASGSNIPTSGAAVAAERKARSVWAAHAVMFSIQALNGFGCIVVKMGLAVRRARACAADRTYVNSSKSRLRPWHRTRRWRLP